ncbi:hypothetical protein GGS21DRAFT_492290 [Xylaria nigripes]|nr:hypothetical protein GGS21DRAFT_492290 [Xylaria nigripes]
MDNIYKTNKHQMPFMSITGYSNTKSGEVFSIVFRIKPDETYTSYEWIINKLAKLAVSLQIHTPNIFFPDYNRSLKLAVSNNHFFSVTTLILATSKMILTILMGKENINSSILGLYSITLR